MKLYITILILFLSLNNYAKQNEKKLLYFDDKIGDVYKINRLSNKKIFLNNKHIKTLNYKYIGKKVVGNNKKSKIITELNNLYKNNKLIMKQYSKFIREKNGSIKVKNNYIYPLIRGVPQFPDFKVSIGDSWQAKGFSVLNVTKLGFRKPILSPIDVRYKYETIKKINGVECAVISAYFIDNLDNKIPAGPMYKKLWVSKSGLLPVRWIGFSNGLYYYSLKDNYIIRFKLNYIHIFILENGLIQEITGSDYANIIRKR